MSSSLSTVVLSLSPSSVAEPKVVSVAEPKVVSVAEPKVVKEDSNVVETLSTTDTCVVADDTSKSGDDSLSTILQTYMTPILNQLSELSEAVYRLKYDLHTATTTSTPPIQEPPPPTSTTLDTTTNNASGHRPSLIVNPTPLRSHSHSYGYDTDDDDRVSSFSSVLISIFPWILVLGMVVFSITRFSSLPTFSLMVGLLVFITAIQWVFLCV